MAERPPAGTIDGPHLKDDGQYLSSPTWIGEAVPDRYMGHPWGFGGECWFVIAYGRVGRRVFAGMDSQALVAAAQEWLRSAEQEEG